MVIPRTLNQQRGVLGEKFAREWIDKNLNCLKCKHSRGKLKDLLGSFSAVDLICEFCGQMYQVKTNTNPVHRFPPSLLGAGFNALEARMDAGIYHPLIIVGFIEGNGGPLGLVRHWKATASIWYLSADLIDPKMYVSYHALIKGVRPHVGTKINTALVEKRFVKLK